MGVVSRGSLWTTLRGSTVVPLELDGLNYISALLPFV